MQTSTAPPPYELTTAQRSELQLAALRDAAGLAQLWEHALRGSFELGRASGYRVGWLAGRDEEAAVWQAIVTGYSTLTRQPARDELARRRRPSNEPCPTACGMCSQCIRGAAVRTNLARYGHPDFPGLTSAGRRPPENRSSGPSEGQVS